MMERVCRQHLITAEEEHGEGAGPRRRSASVFTNNTKQLTESDGREKF